MIKDLPEKNPPRNPAESLYFSKEMKLLTKEDFAQVFQASQKFYSYSIICFAKKNNLPHNRIGLSVGKKVGNAVKRNRIKRILREAFRLNQHQFPQGYDLVLIPKRNQSFDLNEIEFQFRWLTNKIHKTLNNKDLKKIPSKKN